MLVAVYFETSLEGRNYASMIRGLIYRVSPFKLQVLNAGTMISPLLSLKISAFRTPSVELKDSDASEDRYCECTFGDAGPELETECYDAVTMRVYRQIFHLLSSFHLPNSLAVRYHAVGWFKYTKESRGLSSTISPHMSLTADLLSLPQLLFFYYTLN
ncbi:hypothetical protein K438DRAFT_1771851 [Mycena galopus ATCC 62051]|nr:hypothetical protein K438DRAFT_1771851 [Mycena galopus ATCC 62051]